MARVRINPDLLRWARETAGLTLDQAAIKLGMKAARGVSPAAKLEALEAGREQPTRAQLLRMSKQYRRPLIAFYLAAPPPKGDRGEDFRRLPVDYSPVDDGLVDALIRDIRARQSIVRAALEDEEDVKALRFIGSKKVEDGVRTVADSIRGTIGFELRQFRAQRTFTEAFTHLRDLVEAAGVFVLIMSDLGSHHSRINVEAFRGFALADPFAPFIIVNDQDARAAWSFTLFHELAHLWLGQTGISGSLGEAHVERFCNDVASALLLPTEDFSFLDVSRHTEFEVAVERISQFADDRNISRTMVAYKLFSTGAISEQLWIAIRDLFRQQWSEYRSLERERGQEQVGGPNYYVVRRYRAGKALIDFISRTVASGKLTPGKAAKVLGIKPGNVYELLRLAS